MPFTFNTQLILLASVSIVKHPKRQAQRLTTVREDVPVETMFSTSAWSHPESKEELHGTSSSKLTYVIHDNCAKFLPNT